MKLKIYADRMSQPSRAVLIFCKLNKIDFEEIRIVLLKGQHRTPEFKEINPMGQVPAIVDGRFKLFERYPADLFKRAKINSILDWHHSNLRRGTGAVLDEKDRDRVLGPHKRILQWIEDLKTATSPHFEDVHELLYTAKARLHGMKASAPDYKSQSGVKSMLPSKL
ncbi:Glutathione S-transferase T2 [Acorus gramineus]|uniref:Glutathione S-transferase T2 n=1 Tax=Acorus gramineus TaxID=55184 RepID=A0AAV9APS6_ACOGR|nr:Glutathione S-transferase T2 [Acorus gramineus]